MSQGVKRNQAGGIHVSRSMVKEIFAVLDTARKGFINARDLRSTLGHFNGDFDCKFLMNGKKQMTEEELYQMLPYAMKTTKSLMDLKRLKVLLSKMGVKDVSEDDINSLREVLDNDSDGDLSYHEYKELLFNIDPNKAGQNSIVKMALKSVSTEKSHENTKSSRESSTGGKKQPRDSSRSLNHKKKS
eukprot:jgi/Bigna1/66849/fgenesh1_pg.2_\